MLTKNDLNDKSLVNGSRGVVRRYIVNIHIYSIYSITNKSSAQLTVRRYIVNIHTYIHIVYMYV
jgi:hypothetical protein